MSLLLKAFPHGRPVTSARASVRALATVLVTFVALLLTLLPFACSCAGPRRTPAAPDGQAPRSSRPEQPEEAAQEEAAQEEAAPQAEAQAEEAQGAAEATRPAAAQLRDAGHAATSATPTWASPSGWPSATGCSRRSNSTWGGRRTSIGTPRAGATVPSGSRPGPSTTGTSPTHSSPRASVGSACRSSPPRPATRRTPPGAGCASASARSCTAPGYPLSRDTASFARVCRGACRGPGGTAAREVLPVQGRRRRVTSRRSPSRPR